MAQWETHDYPNASEAIMSIVEEFGEYQTVKARTMRMLVGAYPTWSYWILYSQGFTSD